MNMQRILSSTDLELDDVGKRPLPAASVAADNADMVRKRKEALTRVNGAASAVDSTRPNPNATQELRATTTQGAAGRSNTINFTQPVRDLRATTSFGAGQPPVAAPPSAATPPPPAAPPPEAKFKYKWSAGPAATATAATPPTVPAAAPLRPTAPLSAAGEVAYNASHEGRATATEAKMNAAKAKVPGAFTGPAAAANPPNASTGPAAAAKPATMAGRVLNADVGAGAKQMIRSGGSAAKSIMQSPFAPTALATGAMVGAATGYNTSTDQYRLRMGMDPHGSTGGDLAARGVGVMADVGDAITFGNATRLGNFLAGNGYSSNKTAEPVPNTNVPAAPTAAPNPAQSVAGATPAAAPAALPRTQFLRGGSDEAKAASAQIDSRTYIPGNGDGVLRNESTGSVTKFNNATGPVLAPGEAERIAKWHADGDRAREASYARSYALRNAPTTPADGSGWADEVVARKRAARDADRDVILRGQDIVSADGRYGHQLTNEVARNRLRYDMGKDQRDFEVTSRAADDVHLKGNAEAAKDVFKNKFWKKDDKNNDVRDERAEKHAEDISNQLSKGAFGIRPRIDQSELQQDTQELTNMFTQIETPRKTGTNKYLSMVGMGDTPATLSAMPNFKGGTMKKLGPNMTAGTGNNDYEITDANGQVHYMSSMSKRQRELLEEMGIRSFDSPDALRKETK